MSGNSFGKILKLTSFGESHGTAIGGIIEGFPAGFKINITELQAYIKRRSPSDDAFSTSRNETDELEILSGVFEGQTLGTPIGFLIKNNDTRSKDYNHLKEIYRPGHADLTWDKKYGIRDYRGGGRSSARETVSRVVAGGLAIQYLNSLKIDIVASVISLGDIESQIPGIAPTRAEVDSNSIRCVDLIAADEMYKSIEKAKKQKDTLGGIIHCWVTGVPIGLGEPVFDKFQARLAAAMMSINAAKGFAYGYGFNAARIRGSMHNDVFVAENKKIKSIENKAGGILGGISTGENIFFTVAFKPIASIGSLQQTVNKKGKNVDIEIKGRHDVTVVPRAVPIVESMAALTVLDFMLLQNINKH